MTKKRGEIFNHFYLIKSGKIELYDKYFNYMYDLEEGGFFGEFNILFSLYSEYNYKTTLV